MTQIFQGNWPQVSPGNGSIVITGSQVTGGTAAAVPFFSSTGVLTEDPTNFKYDDPNNSLKLSGTEIQGISANNTWLGFNLYYDVVAAAYKHRADGYVSQIYYNGNVTIRTGTTAVAGAVAVLLDSLTVTFDGKFGVNDTTPDATVDINALSAATVGVIVDGFASQTADLLQVRVNGGATLVGVTAAGDIKQTPTANNKSATNKLLIGATTDAATTVQLTTDGGAATASNIITIPNNTVFSGVLNVAVKQSGSASGKQMLRQLCITNNGGVVALQGTPIALGTDTGTAGLATVAVTITANDTDDGINVSVTGVIGTNLRYTAQLFSVETLYA